MLIAVPAPSSVDATRVVLFLEEVVELVAGLEGVDPAVVLQRLLPLRAVVHLVEVGDQLVAPLVGDAGRREHAAPVGEDQVDVRLLERRHVLDRLAGEPLLAGDREHAQLAGVDLALELAEPGEADLDLLAEQGAGQRPAAVVRDVA